MELFLRDVDLSWCVPMLGKLGPILFPLLALATPVAASAATISELSYQVDGKPVIFIDGPIEAGDDEVLPSS
jgi:hypothetical protein